MNVRVWITALALVWVLGCEKTSEDVAVQPSTPESSAQPSYPDVSAQSSLTRHCCDESLSNCDPEPTKNCAADPERPVINWE